MEKLRDGWEDESKDDREEEKKDVNEGQKQDNGDLRIPVFDSVFEILRSPFVKE